MIEAKPWSYHVDGSPVYSLADIIAELDQRSSQVARALRRRGLPTGGVRPGEKAAPDETAIILYTSSSARPASRSPRPWPAPPPASCRNRRSAPA